MSLADELLADLEDDDNEELEEIVKVKVEDEDDGKSLDSKLVIVSRFNIFQLYFQTIRSPKTRK